MLSKNKKSNGNKNNLTVDNLQKNRKNNVIESENIDIVLKVNNGVCDLCNHKTKDTQIHFIDSSKTIDMDSILNLVVLCNICKSEVDDGAANLDDKLKEIAFDKMDRVIEFTE